MERRLAAILAADVAGYSRLMEADEEAPAHVFRTCREVFDGLEGVAARHTTGRISMARPSQANEAG